MCADSSTHTKAPPHLKKKKSCDTCHLKLVTCHLSPVVIQQCQQLQQQTLPLLTTPLCTVGWFTQKESKSSIWSNYKYYGNVIQINDNSNDITNLVLNITVYLKYHWIGLKYHSICPKYQWICHYYHRIRPKYHRIGPKCDLS